LHLDPRPTEAAIHKVYPDNYVTHQEGKKAHLRDNGTSFFWEACNAYLNHRFGTKRQPANERLAWLVKCIPPVRLQLDYFYRHLPRKPGRLLDVGAGNGAFLLRAREAGWQVQGLEPDSRAVLAAQSEGIDVVHGSISTFHVDAEFDQVCLSHVLEHLHDPTGALVRIFGWLKPGGRVWLALPNPTGLGSRIFAENWFALDPPRHLVIPPQAELRRILEKAGFVDVQIVRRGRGSRSSIAPSFVYARTRGRSTWFGAGVLAGVIDVLSTLHPMFGEESVVTARRPQ